MFKFPPTRPWIVAIRTLGFTCEAIRQQGAIGTSRTELLGLTL